MQEEHQCKKGTVILVDYSNGKRWLVVLLGEEKKYLEIFETEKDARVYLETLIAEEVVSRTSSYRKLKII